MSKEKKERLSCVDYLLVVGSSIMRPHREVDCGQPSPVVPMRGSVIHNLGGDSQRKGCFLYARSLDGKRTYTVYLHVVLCCAVGHSIVDPMPFSPCKMYNEYPN
ncbi:hypothetical protein AVEN_48896-1 [Araneus ventricosus]|uniref:Uncharacterized protein n=1 Tax=Araneus ventricosus TaxID=182803 RepID=A0A4Y2AJ10_ARAVE|nr:hypothetical protein AVEN_48896-1 [Araneus ventricosus]